MIERMRMRCACSCYERPMPAHLFPIRTLSLLYISLIVLSQSTIGMLQLFTLISSIPRMGYRLYDPDVGSSGRFARIYEPMWGCYVQIFRSIGSFLTRKWQTSLSRHPVTAPMHCILELCARFVIIASSTLHLRSTNGYNLCIMPSSMTYWSSWSDSDLLHIMLSKLRHFGWKRCTIESTSRPPCELIFNDTNSPICSSYAAPSKHIFHFNAVILITHNECWKIVEAFYTLKQHWFFEFDWT